MSFVQGLALLLILSAVSAVDAQTTTGSFFGDVTDTSGAVLAGVSVRIVSLSTGAARETETNSVGTYQFDGLPPADYVMTFEFRGFRSLKRTGLTLPIQGRIKLDFKMEVGGVSARPARPLEAVYIMRYLCGIDNGPTPLEMTIRRRDTSSGVLP
jgi:hypothetical protein